MSNNYINNLLKVIQPTTHQAEYINKSISDKPEECILPELRDPPNLNYTPVTPSNIKSCGPLFIEFPVIPPPFPPTENCPEGITFIDNPVSIYAQQSDVDINAPAGEIIIGAMPPADNICEFRIEVPPIIIPCYPTGPQITSSVDITVVDPNDDTTTTTPIIISKSDETACTWEIIGNPTITLPKIPEGMCPNGFTWIDAAVISTGETVLEKGTITLGLNVNSYSFSITLPTGIFLGDSGTVTIAPQTESATYEYTWAVSTPAWATLSSNSGNTISITAADTAGMIKLYLHVDVNNGALTGDFWYPITLVEIPVEIAQDGLSLISLQDYQRSVGMDVTNDCGAALVGSLGITLPEMSCPEGYTVSGTEGANGVLTFGVGAETTTTTLGIDTCTLGFNNLNIPALICDGGYVNSTVDITVAYDPESAGEFTGTVGNATGNTGGQYCGFAINGTLTLPPSANTDPDATHYKGTYSPSKEPYSNGDIVRVPTDENGDSVIVGSTPGVYICQVVTDNEDPDYTGPYTGHEIPKNPAQDGGESTHWRWLSTWPKKVQACTDSGLTTYISDTQPDQ